MRYWTLCCSLLQASTEKRLAKAGGHLPPDSIVSFSNVPIVIREDWNNPLAARNGVQNSPPRVVGLAPGAVDRVQFFFGFI